MKVSEKQIKNLAKLFCQTAAQSGVTHSQALELIARGFDSANWQTFQAALQKKDGPQNEKKTSTLNKGELANIQDVLMDAKQAFRTLANQAGDVEEWNEGGEAYQASHRITRLREHLEKLAETGATSPAALFLEKAMAHGVGDPIPQKTRLATFEIRVAYPDDNTPYDPTSLGQLAHDIDQGDCIGSWQKTDDIPLKTDEIEPVLLALGNDGSFFGNPDSDNTTRASH